MTVPPPYLSDSVHNNHSMKNFLNRVLGKYNDSFQILNFYSKGFKRDLLILLILSVLVGLMETFQIVLLGPILDASFNLQAGELFFFAPLYTLVRNTLRLPDVIAFCLLFIIFVFLTVIVSLLYSYFSLRFTKKVLLEKKKALFDKLMKNDYRYFVDNRRGDILYSAITAPSGIKNFFDVSTLLFSDSIVILSILAMLLFISAFGVALLLAGGILFIFVVRLIGKRVAYRLGNLQLQSIQSENEVINSYVQGVRQIRSANGDPYWEKQYNSALHHYWEKFTKYEFLSNAPKTVLQLFFFSTTAGAVIFLFYFYGDKFITVVPLIGIFAFAALKIHPRLSSISCNYMSIMGNWPCLESVYQFLNDNRYNILGNGEEKFETLTSDIILDDVGFSYNVDQELIKGVHLTIRRNKVTALVGHSGSGKSTIVSLLLRYYDVSSGRILINGIDLRKYDMKTLLRKMGYVSQDAFLFNATIRENIAFGGDYSDDQIIEAAKKANIHTFISNHILGYNSMVGDQGLKLSGGEKQRIAIARALVRDPEILVLDEATSNLDNESESIVQDSINRVSENITTFIIAHRLSTIRNADTIFVMSGGRIVENGSHDKLMEKRGRYFELYEFAERVNSGSDRRTI